jgi:hypothetical protein
MLLFGFFGLELVAIEASAAREDSEKAGFGEAHEIAEDRGRVAGVLGDGLDHLAVREGAFGVSERPQQREAAQRDAQVVRVEQIACFVDVHEVSVEDGETVPEPEGLAKRRSKGQGLHEDSAKGLQTQVACVYGRSLPSASQSSFTTHFATQEMRPMRSTPLRLPRAGFPVLLLAVGLNGAAELAAQSTRVVPNVNTAREGSSAARTPFSHQQGRIQWLANGAELCQTSAVLLSLEMRLDGFNFNRAGQAGTVDVKAELYHVPFTPSTLTNVWTQNIGSATGQVVYNGTLNLPAVTQQRPLPNPFSLRIPLDRPFVYQRAQGNLLLDLQTSNGTSSDWPLDGIFISGSGYGSQAIKIWEEPSCSNLRGDSAKLSISSSQGALGQGLQVDHTVNPAPGGQLDLVMHWMGLSNAAYGPAALPLDLSGLGYQNCALATDILFTATTNGAGIVWPIPASPEFEGVALYFQALAIDSKSLDHVITSNAYQVLLGRPEHDPGGPAADGPSRALQRGADGLPLAERLLRCDHRLERLVQLSRGGAPGRGRATSSRAR